MYICICKAVTVDQVEEAVEAGARDLDQIQELCQACTDCGTCRFKVQRLLREKLASAPPSKGGRKTAV